MVFHITSFLYTHNNLTTSQIMMRVVLAILPGIVTQWYFFGYGNLIQIVLAVIIAWSTEAAILYLRRQPVLTGLKDHSALLTAMLLGVSLPPLAPWWLIVIGTTFAIIIAKQLYGGLGHNPFNPAMIGYIVLLISFPIQITSWLPSRAALAIVPSLSDTIKIIFNYHTLAGDTLHHLQISVDGISQATPLTAFKTRLLYSRHNVQQLSAQLIFDNVIASIAWKWINISYLLGGLFLLWTNIIRWHIPASFLASLAVCATLGQFFSSNTLISPLIHLFSGATMLGAFFIATDPVTSSTTHKGQLFFGMLIGLLVWLIRSFGSYPDGVAFAVILANICVPLIDYYTQPRVYGHHS